MTPYLRRSTLFPPLIQLLPAEDLELVVVVPAREEDQLLRSLRNLTGCLRPPGAVEIIVVINSSEADNARVKLHNNRILRETLAWAKKNNEKKFTFHILHFPSLPAKHAGVGLVRKIGMDEACRRLEKAGHPNGVIAAFDADSRCDANYLTELYDHFQRFPDTQACSIYFEHPLKGTDYPAEVYRAITHYELHLRYFIDAQRYAGFPFACQTLGSSMAVRCNAYQQQGGMNRRKAGEDFYFLHKFTALGRLSELNTTRIIPSPRPSHRVPFGTGRTVQELVQSSLPFETYAPDSFQDLKELPASLPALCKLADSDWNEFTGQWPDSLRDFFERAGGRAKIAEIRRHTSSPETFKKRFFQWFNAFQAMKFVHFARDHYYPNVPVEQGARWLLKELVQETAEKASAKELLLRFRGLDRNRRNV
jgi:hypothetical protein